MHRAPDSLRLVSVFGWGGVFAVHLQSSAGACFALCARMSVWTYRRATPLCSETAESAGERPRVNEDKMGMRLLPALKASVQLPSAPEWWHLSCLSSITGLISPVAGMPRPSPSSVKGRRWREGAGAASTRRGNWIPACRGRLPLCS